MPCLIHLAELLRAPVPSFEPTLVKISTLSRLSRAFSHLPMMVSEFPPV